jgi:hypothetical protein
MPANPAHRSIRAGAHRVPPPFGSLAVRSDEPQHAWHARAPYGRVHVVHTAFLDAGARAALAAAGWSGITLAEPLDIGHAGTTPAALAAAAPQVADLAGQIASALQHTGVLGADPAAYRQATAGRIDHLGCRGAGFHNDVGGHWSRSLFWVLALALDGVEFVQPHAGLRLPLAPGDLLLFDPCMAHGLCRPADGGQALASSFQHGRQLFLTGELLLDDAQWAALGAPWLPVEHHAAQAALDLLVAEFDPQSGAIKRPRSLCDGMLRSICHADLAG